MNATSRSMAVKAPGSPDVVKVDARCGPDTLGDWRHFCQTSIERPALVTPATYENAAPAQRRTYDRARRRYHRSISDIETRQMAEANLEIDSRVDGNDGCPPTARTGFVINGLPLLGKSTILLRWAKTYEQELRQDLGIGWDARTSRGALFVPVVYVILGDNDGPKGFCQRIMRFFGEPTRKPGTKVNSLPGSSH